MMMQITPEKTFSNSELTMEAGETYLADQVNIGQFLVMMARGREKADVMRWTADGVRLCSSNRIAVVRTGGFGDLVMLTPPLLDLAENGVVVEVSAFKRFHPAIQHLHKNIIPVPYPLHISRRDRTPYGRIVGLGDLVEEGIHPTDAFSEALGVQPKDKKPKWVVTMAEDDDASKILEPLGRPIIGIQPMASTLIRSYSPTMTGQVLRQLSTRAPEPFFAALFGAPGQLSTFTKHMPMPLPGGMCAGVIDYTGPEWTMDFRTSAAVLSKAKGFIGVDSALLHVAGALDVPSVGLYGPFPWKERTKYSPSIHSLQGRAPEKCSPCHYHSYGGPEFPEGQICGDVGACTAMMDISPERIAKTLIKKAWKK